MNALRWMMLILVLASVVCVGRQACWMTSLSAPGQCLGVHHAETAPLWSPPLAKSLPEVLRDLDRSSGWDGVDAAQVTSRIEVVWEPMLANLLLLLVPATLLPGVLYARLRGRRRDLVLHVGLRSGVGLAGGLLASVILWLVFGGWGPPLSAMLGLVGLGLGLVTAVVSAAATTTAGDSAPIARARLLASKER